MIIATIPYRSMETHAAFILEGEIGGENNVVLQEVRYEDVGALKEFGPKQQKMLEDFFDIYGVEVVIDTELERPEDAGKMWEDPTRRDIWKPWPLEEWKAARYIDEAHYYEDEDISDDPTVIGYYWQFEKDILDTLRSFLDE